MCANSGSCSELEERLKTYLEGQNGSYFPGNWRIQESPISGRGVFARRDIRENEIVFADTPLVVGPRTNSNCPVVCVNCGHSLSAVEGRGQHSNKPRPRASYPFPSPSFSPCPAGCTLPLCASCLLPPRSTAPPCEHEHRFECKFIRDLKPKFDPGSGESFSRTLYKTVTPIRCLKLNESQRDLVRCLQSNDGPQHSFEVDLLKRSVDETLSTDDEEFMRLCCRVMDANAFETVALSTATAAVKGTKTTGPGPGVTEESSLRGLYPLSAIMNHSCSPNTRHGFDPRHRMIVRATKFIAADQEITTSYSQLLWPTPRRRKHLLETKHFLCACYRCQDPTELETWLFFMDCPTRGCSGQLSPSDITSITSSWSCNMCKRVITSEQISILQNMQNDLASNFNLGDPQTSMDSLSGGHKFGTAIVQKKLTLIWRLGYPPPLKLTELAENVLLFKKRLCEDILQLLEALQLGLCRLRGLVLYELSLVLNELKRRKVKGKGKNANSEMKRLSETLESTLKEAMTILKRE